MSTKTTFKRVALVAVAALGFGTAVVSPAAAVDYLQGSFSRVSFVTPASAGAPGTESSAIINLGGSCANAAAGTVIQQTYYVSIVSAPPTTNLAANSVFTVPVGGSDYDTTVPTGYTQVNGSAFTISSQDFPAGQDYAARVMGECTDNSKAMSVFSKVRFTPDVVGTYVIAAVPADNSPTRATATWTVTVAPKAAANSTSSTAVTTAAGAGSGTDTTGIYGPRTAGAAAVATILVTASNGSTTAALAAGDALSKTATISGPGLISWDGGTTKGRTVASAAGTLAQTLSVYGDGAAGVATITISDSAAQFSKTKTVTFYGSVASYVLTVKNKALAVGSSADTQVLTVEAKDASGVVIPNATVNVSSSSTATATVDSATVTTGADGTAADIGVNGVAKGDAVITVANAASSATVTATATISVVTAGVASLALSFDKAEYTAGEKATLTITAKNSDGVLVGDQAYVDLFATGGISSSAALAADLSATARTLTNGVATYTVYMPLAVGPVTVAATLGLGVATAIQATAVSAVATVLSDGVAQAAVDAAAEATDAANAATDAANAAAEAADAATAAAQDAADAVAALSTQVAEMVDALKKQITALTNLVIKIQKKVKA
jgi:hypothetical protein